uniref:Coiled-coil domain containing 88B n=1 Tax=Seriola dumerili TaxID=41447 RepID=A0A3B4UX84_SERDU
MDSNIMEIIEEFMESALAQWVHLFEKMVGSEDGVPLYSQYMEVNSISQSARDRYLRLTNGIFLNEVMRVRDPNPKVERLYDSGRDDHMLRVQNFSILNRHLRAFYQEDLQQLILMPLPSVAILGQDPLTVEELRRLLLLLLGCAVQLQCEKKETFIQQIQSLDIETQAAIASCIQQVTQDPHVVLPLQWEELMEVEGADLQLVFSSMAKQIQSLLANRDTHMERIAEMCRERESQADSTTAPLGGHSEEPPQGLALQLADSKAKLRRLKQQEDKGDQLLDYTQEIQTMEEQLKKLQKENRSLQGEVRGMRALRDELDCARERAARAEQLQTELQSCKHRLRSLELTRTQLKEQQQLCAALQETKALLEEQLAGARARCSSVRELERDNHLLRQKIMDVEAERDTERQRVDELLEMNMSLEADLRHISSSGGSGGSIPAPVAAVHQSFLQSELDSDEQKPLSVEVGEASTLRLLGAEQENAELRRRLEELQAQQEFQNLKNENGTLKQHLEQLVTKLQFLEDKTKEEGMKKPDRGEEEKGERGVQGSESFRGEGEGRVRMMEGRERRGEIIRTQREAGVGEEVLRVQGGKGEPCNEETESKRRGEAEGGQKNRERQEKESDLKEEQIALTSSTKSTQDTTETSAADQAACALPAPDVELLTTRLQEAQEEADRQATVAQDLHSKLAEQSRKTWEAEQRLVVLEAELQRLKKAAESLGEARRQIEQVLQSESLTMEEELCRLRSQTELHRMQTTVIATLEGERAALERDRDTLRSTQDALRTAQRKCDQLELTTQTLKAELERQGRSLETSRRREEELEAELREATLEAESLARARDQASLEASRLEQEKEVCQSELDGQRKEGRQREREAARLRQQLESTTLALEHSNQRARALDAEHEALQSRLSQSQEACAHFKEQLEALRRNSLSLQDSCTRLQTLNTQLQQVDQASLSSQHSAALARCSESEARCASLEAESKVWAREREESVARMEALRRDHERMTALQQRQEVELEELLDKHSQLRSSNRSLEAQHRELEALQAHQKEWLASQAELLAQGSVLRGELSASQLERTRLEGELSALRETNQSLDLSNARLTSQYQLLTQLKGNMEEENRQLAEQNQGLLKENRALLEQSLERRDQHYSQQREYEKLSELRREKQKLVEKIMDQYRVLEKSNWIADRMKKLIKPRGGGREGRALFTAAGSVENLADSTEFTSDAHTSQPSAPVSPSLLRKAPSQTEPDISVPGTPTLRSGSGGRRKLGSRHGWGLGLARGGSGVSQSFSPGDNKTPPRQRLRSSQNTPTVLWEGDRGETNAPQAADTALTTQGSVDEDQGK